MKTTLNRWLVACVSGSFAFLTSGCFWNECGWNEHKYETWTRKLTVVENLSAFPDSTVTATEPRPSVVQAFAEVYNNDPSERGERIAREAPRVISLGFKTFYSAPRLRSWKDAGLFVNPSTDTNVYTEGVVLHQIVLDSSGLPAGTYSFSAADTVGPLRGRVRYHALSLLVVGGAEDVLRPARLSGNITITEAFTKNSGAFTYRVETEFLPGQISTFTGAVSFDGVQHYEACVQNGVAID